MPGVPSWEIGAEAAALATRSPLIYYRCFTSGWPNLPNTAVPAPNACRANAPRLNDVIRRYTLRNRATNWHVARDSRLLVKKALSKIPLADKNRIASIEYQFISRKKERRLEAGVVAALSLSKSHPFHRRIDYGSGQTLVETFSIVGQGHSPVYRCGCTRNDFSTRFQRRVASRVHRWHACFCRLFLQIPHSADSRIRSNARDKTPGISRKKKRTVGSCRRSGSVTNNRSTERR